MELKSYNIDASQFIHYRNLSLKRSCEGKSLAVALDSVPFLSAGDPLTQLLVGTRRMSHFYREVNTKHACGLLSNGTRWDM